MAIMQRTNLARTNALLRQCTASSKIAAWEEPRKQGTASSKVAAWEEPRKVHIGARPLPFRPPPGLEEFGPRNLDGSCSYNLTCSVSMSIGDMSTDVSTVCSSGSLSEISDEMDYDYSQFLGEKSEKLVKPSPTPPRAREGKTTMIMQNLPKELSRDQLIDLIDSEGFAGTYDFVYCPIEFGSLARIGKAFVNFCTPAVAERFHAHFHGFTRWASNQVCAVDYCRDRQGLEAHIEHFRNSPVMHKSIPEGYKPLLLVQGQRTPFPSPTKRIRTPLPKGQAPAASGNRR